jgi:hypothetical protein
MKLVHLVAGLLMVLLNVAPVSCHSSDGVSSMLQFLADSWLIRPATGNAATLTSNYTHILQLKISLADESTLFGTVEPFEMESPPWIVVKILETYLSLEQTWYKLLGRQPQRLNTEPEESPPSVPIFRSFDISVVEDNYISGSVVIGQRPSDACPDQRQLNLTYAAHFSTTEHQPSRFRIASGRVSAAGRLALDAEPISGSPCAEWNRQVTTYTFVAVDSSNILLTLESAPAADAAPEVEGGMPPAALFYKFHLLRRETPKGDWLGNSLGTIVLLVVVALIKFGPRAYLRWKGVNPAELMGRGRGGNKQMSLQQRLELVKKQRDILDEMKSKKML